MSIERGESRVGLVPSMAGRLQVRLVMIVVPTYRRFASKGQMMRSSLDNVVEIRLPLSSWWQQSRDCSAKLHNQTFPHGVLVVVLLLLRYLINAIISK